jgi:hypothetical protein
VNTATSTLRIGDLPLRCTPGFITGLDEVHNSTRSRALSNRRAASIQTDLGFSQAELQWVISAYALLFGGFLLLGGRARPAPAWHWSASSSRS